MEPALPAVPLPQHEQASAITRFMVRTLTAHAGRGPESTRAHVTEDAVTVVMRNSLCRAERTVVGVGQADLIRHSRRAVQTAMQQDLVAGVEAITGRRVAAFLSDHDVLTDISIEAFVLV